MADEPENANDAGNENELADSFLGFLEEKRSVRAFDPDPPPPEALEYVVRAAATAPFSGRSPAWHFILVRERRVLERLQTAATSGLNKLNFWVNNAPVILVACAKPERSLPFSRGLPSFVMDTAVALERASLMAHQMGIGSCWIGAFDEKGARRACRIPSSHRVVALLALGYPRESSEGPFGMPVINDFGQYYDLIRSKYEHQRHTPWRRLFSYNYFP